MLAPSRSAKVMSAGMWHVCGGCTIVHIVVGGLFYVQYQCDLGEARTGPWAGSGRPRRDVCVLVRQLVASIDAAQRSLRTGSSQR